MNNNAYYRQIIHNNFLPDHAPSVAYIAHPKGKSTQCACCATTHSAICLRSDRDEQFGIPISMSVTWLWPTRLVCTGNFNRMKPEKWPKNDRHFLETTFLVLELLYIISTFIYVCRKYLVIYKSLVISLVIVLWRRLLNWEWSYSSYISLPRSYDKTTYCLVNRHQI